MQGYTSSNSLTPQQVLNQFILNSLLQKPLGTMQVGNKPLNYLQGVPPNFMVNHSNDNRIMK